MTYREIVYAILDQLKLLSDDTYYNEDHVLFLISKIRGMILKQRYSDIRKDIPSSNYQTICIDLIQVPAIEGDPCSGGSYLKSKYKIPSTLNVGTETIYPIDFYQGTHITFINRERMRFVGHNKWLQNIIYASLGPDNYLYFKSSNPQFLYLDKVMMSGIFEDPQEAEELQCEENKDDTCDILDKKFPLEEGLVTTVIDLALRYLTSAAYAPKDELNDTRDQLSDIMSFIKRNMKNNFQKKSDDD